MSSQMWFLVLLFLFILVICLLVAAFPGRRWYRNRQQHIHFTKQRTFTTVLRSQVGTVILPEIPILTTPTTVLFNRPSSTNPLTVPKSGNYMVNYSVQLHFASEATASAAIHIADDSNPAGQDLIGSQMQSTLAITSTVPIEHSFLAFLSRNSTLALQVQASDVDRVSIPASDSGSLQIPTTLASLTLTEI